MQLVVCSVVQLITIVNLVKCVWKSDVGGFAAMTRIAPRRRLAVESVVPQGLMSAHWMRIAPLLTKCAVLNKENAGVGRAVMVHLKMVLAVKWILAMGTGKRAVAAMAIVWCFAPPRVIVRWAVFVMGNIALCCWRMAKIAAKEMTVGAVRAFAVKGFAVMQVAMVCVNPVWVI